MRCFATLVASLLLLSGCGNNPTQSGQTGTLKMSLTDAPARYAYGAVNITFSEISANIGSDWVTVRNQPVTVNLLEWNNGKSIVVGDASLPAGHYSQIRLKIDQADVVIAGQTFSMTVPSGAQTGLKLVSSFDVNAGSTYELVLDFDAQRSVVATGNQKFMLKPTIRVTPLADTGSISGTVTNHENAPVAYAISGQDTLTSAAPDSVGAFQLAFLKAGVYTVAIQDTLGLSDVQSGVTVTAGSDQSLGSLTLQ